MTDARAILERRVRKMIHMHNKGQKGEGALLAGLPGAVLACIISRCCVYP